MNIPTQKKEKSGKLGCHGKCDEASLFKIMQGNTQQPIESMHSKQWVNSTIRSFLLILHCTEKLLVQNNEFYVKTDYLPEADSQYSPSR
jgi:hypothetical protein